MKSLPIRVTSRLLLCLLFPSTAALTQATTASLADATTLLETARSRQILELKDSKPFHLRVSYQTSDYLGNANGEGTLEEFWDGHNSKRIETYRGVSATTIRTDAALIVSGMPPDFATVEALRKSIFDAIPSGKRLAADALTEQPATMGPLTTRCFVLTPKQRVQVDAQAKPDADRSTASCLTKDGGILRLAQFPPGYTASYNDLKPFGKQLIAHTITLRQGPVARGKLTVDELSEWTPDPAILTAAPGAVSYIRPAGTNVEAGRKISSSQPEYPAVARAVRAQGEVVLSGVISREGLMTNLEVLSSSNAMFDEPALEAVKGWRYVPYRLGGQPVPVASTVVIHFHP